MFQKINHIFDFNQKALNLYAKRQEIIAANIANADTPGYQSKSINFKDELNKILHRKNINDKNLSLKTTSPYHLNAKKYNVFAVKNIPVIVNPKKLNANTVDMDKERVEFINNSLKYESSLSFIKNEIRNIMRVLQG